MKSIDFQSLMQTANLLELKKKFPKWDELQFFQDLIKRYNQVPAKDLEGGEDIDFFTFQSQGIEKIFASRNEIGGLTLMLPEDY